MKRCRGILWDKDGTLLDTFSFWVGLERRLATTLGDRFGKRAAGYAERVLGALGVGADGRVASNGVLASGTESAILDVFYDALGDAPPLRREFDRQARLELISLLKEAPSPPVFPGIVEILERARAAGLAQGVATADRGSNASRDLRLSELEPFFGFVASSDSPGVKPDAWPVAAFAAWAGISPAEVLVVGDTAVDRAMADAAGAGFVGVLWGTGQQSDFAGAATARDPHDLSVFWEPA